MPSPLSAEVKHWLQNLSLIFLSLITLPISISVVLLAFSLGPFTRAWKHEPKLPTKDKKVILVTGVSMTKGLSILQLLAKHTHHDILGADTSPLSPGRVSRYCKKFILLPVPNPRDSSNYIQAMLDLVNTHRVDLWISCSGVLSAIEDAQVKEVLEKRTRCKAVQFDVQTTRTLHEKDQFIKFVRDECGLLVPETLEVRSRDEALDKLLSQYQSKATTNGSKTPPPTHQPTKQFILKPIGVDDANRADMTLLPHRSSPTQTKTHISRLPITPSTPWLLQEYIPGQEYCTHALIINSRVALFLACPSAELLMHYEALPPPDQSALTCAMLRFTERVVRRLSEGGERERAGGFTGHLSFDFLVRGEDVAMIGGGDGKREEEVRLYPIECNPRAHTATVLFRGCGAEVAGAYLRVLEDGEGEGKGAREPFYPTHTARYYWLPHDIVTLVLLPLLGLLSRMVSLLTGSKASASDVDIVGSLDIFLEHVFLWRDGTFTVDDPLPALWLYHVYWPGQFLNSLWTGKRWSRINVSTTKMFGME